MKYVGNINYVLIILKFNLLILIWFIILEKKNNLYSFVNNKKKILIDFLNDNYIVLGYDLLKMIGII